MSTIEIILATISVAMIIEGAFVSLFPEFTIKAIKKVFKNKQEVVKMGLIEIILSLIILFIISL